MHSGLYFWSSHLGVIKKVSLELAQSQAVDDYREANK